MLVQLAVEVGPGDELRQRARLFAMERVAGRSPSGKRLRTRDFSIELDRLTVKLDWSREAFAIEEKHIDICFLRLLFLAQQRLANVLLCHVEPLTVSTRHEDNSALADNRLLLIQV